MFFRKIYTAYLQTNNVSMEAALLTTLISVAVEAAREDLYEVFEEVRCPTLMASCRDNCPNEKPGGLAQNIYK